MPDEQHPSRAWQQFKLQSAASAWLAKAAAAGMDTVQPASLWNYGTEVDAHGTFATCQLKALPVSSTFYLAAYVRGLVLHEPFGGLCAGLEATLRNGFKVSQDVYSDTEPAVQRIALHCRRTLQSLYLSQLATSALEGCFSLLPVDVNKAIIGTVKACGLRSAQTSPAAAAAVDTAARCDTSVDTFFSVVLTCAYWQQSCRTTGLHLPLAMWTFGRMDWHLLVFCAEMDCHSQLLSCLQLHLECMHACLWIGLSSFLRHCLCTSCQAWISLRALLH